MLCKMQMADSIDLFTNVAYRRWFKRWLRHVNRTDLAHDEQVVVVRTHISTVGTIRVGIIFTNKISCRACTGRRLLKSSSRRSVWCIASACIHWHCPGNVCARSITQHDYDDRVLSGLSQYYHSAIKPCGFNVKPTCFESGMAWSASFLRHFSNVSRAASRTAFFCYS
jgi:hypothetical protein